MVRLFKSVGGLIFWLALSSDLNLLGSHVLQRCWQYVLFLDSLISLLWLGSVKGKGLLGSGFPGSSNGKESACNAGDLGSVPGLRRSPGEGGGHPLQYLSWPGVLHGQKGLAGHSPWGRRVRQDWATHTSLPG